MSDAATRRPERRRATFAGRRARRFRSTLAVGWGLLFSCAALAQAPPPRPSGKEAPCRPDTAQLYIAPMGQPFRAAAGEPDPTAAWFAQADSDHDGRLTAAEFTADAVAFFRRLDTDRNGELEPAEFAAYENDVAPEIRLYQRPSQRWIEGRISRKERKAAGKYGGALGAGRWSQLNIPQPVLSADLDLNGGVTAKEFRDVALQRFGMLAPVDGTLRLAALAPTPARQEAAACAAEAAKRRR